MKSVGKPKQQGISYRDTWRSFSVAVWPLLMVLFTVGYWIDGVLFDRWWLMGVLFFSFPFTVWVFGRSRLGAQTPRQERLELWVVLLVTNLPFWLFFLSGRVEGAAVLWLTGMVVAGLVYGGFKKGLVHVPGLDVVLTGLLLASPYVFGVLLRDQQAIWWLPGWVAATLWLMAGYLVYLIAHYGVDLQRGKVTAVTKIGVEKSLVITLGLYVVVILLPAIYYGWQGLIASGLLLPFAILIFRSLHVREHATSPTFYRTWLAIRRYAYVSGTLLALYLLATLISD